MKITSKIQLFKHMLKQHNQQYILTYQDLYGKSKCQFCNNKPLFNQKTLKPKKYCVEHKLALKKQNSILCKQFYLKRGYSYEEAIQIIANIQRKNSKKYNDCYSKEKLIEQGYTQQQAQQKVIWRRKHNPRCRDVHTEEQVNNVIQKATNTLKNTLQQKPKGYYRASSMNFYKTQHLSQEQRRKIIRENGYCKDNPKFNTFKNSLTIEYYINLGYTQLQAKQKLKERQATFSLEKCIKKYGEEKGLEVFNKRQEKWLKSLNTPENIEKIKKGQLKGFTNAKSKNWSKISQQLFNNILNEIDLSQYKVYFHDLNFQYVVQKEVGFRLLDFYIEELNFAIQFDGTYWHKDDTEEIINIRDNEIKNILNNIEILHIKEQNYIKNKIGTIKFIVERIKELINASV